MNHLGFFFPFVTVAFQHSLLKWGSHALTGATCQYLTTLVCSFHSPTLLQHEKHSLSSRTRQQNSLLRVPESCLQVPRSFEKRRRADTVTVRAPCHVHCTHIGTRWAWLLTSTNTLMPTAPICAVIALCVVYRLCFFRKGQGPRGSVAFHPLLSIHTYWTICSTVMTFHMWKKISFMQKHPQLVQSEEETFPGITALHMNIQLWSPWQGHWLLLLPAGHVVFLHTRSIIPIPSADI